MARFTQYPTASTGDYADATTFLIANSDGDIKQASLEGLRDIFGCGIQCAQLAITSAQVLALNSTPLTIVAAQGAGTIIDPVAAFYFLDYNSAAYATNTNLTLIHSGATKEILNTNTLAGTTSKYVKFEDGNTPAVGETQLITNANLQVSVDNGDPVTGDSDIEVFVLYRVITI